MEISLEYGTMRGPRLIAKFVQITPISLCFTVEIAIVFIGVSDQLLTRVHRLMSWFISAECCTLW